MAPTNGQSYALIWVQAFGTIQSTATSVTQQFQFCVYIRRISSKVHRGGNNFVEESDDSKLHVPMEGDGDPNLSASERSQDGDPKEKKRNANMK